MKISQQVSQADELLLECEALRREVEQLQVALTSRDAIGQAKGVIQVLFRCDEQAAFSALVRLSQDTNRKVSELSLMIMDVATHGRTLTERTVTSLRRGIESSRRVAS